MLEKIKAGKIKMKPKWWFVTKIWGIRAIYWIIILTAAMGAGSVYYFFDLYRPNELAEFAELGWGLIWEDFPIWGSIIFGFCLIAAIIIDSMMGENYRKTKARVAITTFLIILTAGLIMFLLKIGV